MTSRVFCAQRTRFDMSSAASYGKIVYLLPDRWNPLNLDETASLLLDELRRHNFHPAHDLVVLSGQVITTALLLTAALSAAQRFDEEKLLVMLFDARTDLFVVRTLSTEVTAGGAT